MEVCLKTIRPDHAVIPKVRSDNLPLLCPPEFCAPVLWGHGEVVLLTFPGSFPTLCLLRASGFFCPRVTQGAP